MIIKKTHQRKTKYNFYTRYIIETGLTCYYIHCNNKEITSIRERTYFDGSKDDCSEKPISLSQLPEFIFNEFKKTL